MAYDPQKKHRRPTPAEEGPAPVDALMTNASPESRAMTDDPPAAPTVTPPAADPPADALLIKAGLIAAAMAAVALVVTRHLRSRRCSHATGK